MAHSHTWKFIRIGGFDQVAIETGADLLHLKHLDQKLWVALACPVKGLEIDEKTLVLIDTDKDGRIRAPELLAAIDWAALHLETLDPLLAGRDTLPLSAFKTSTPQGQAALAAAKRILTDFGKTSATEITLADAADTARLFAATPFNGDGVITPASTTDAALQQVLADILATVGGAPDRGGATGVDQARLDAFYADLAAHAAWRNQGAAAALLPFGERTAAALAALQAVRAKVDDFFTRARLASFDARSLAALNRSESDYLALATRDLSLSAQEFAGFPLSQVQPGSPLPLLTAVNPAWSAALAALHRDAVAPAFGADKVTLAEADWTVLKARLEPYEKWLAAKAGASVEKLGAERIAALLAANHKDALAALIARDKALEPEFNAIATVEKLLRYARDFRALVNNFVNFYDFYHPTNFGVFQAGHLYLDSRSTELCIEVAGPSPLAAMSKAYIAYCDLKRAGLPPRKIAACFTNGDSDYLFVGRNGVFYDRQGRDWDATITAIVDNPISIRQAFFAPYKKFVRLVEEQIAKRATAADAEANAKLAAAAGTVATADKAPPKPADKKLDIGSVAAIGIAVGAIGTFLTTLAGYVAGVFAGGPLLIAAAILGVVLAISGPSMLIAGLKLRQRTLGPLLDANGWAINGRVKINIPFGTKLTERARLPAGARRDLRDPYEDKDAARSKRWLVVVLVLVAVAAIWIRYDHHTRGRYFWQPAPAENAPDKVAPATTLPAAATNSSTPAC